MHCHDLPALKSSWGLHWRVCAPSWGKDGHAALPCSWQSSQAGQAAAEHTNQMAARPVQMLDMPAMPAHDAVRLTAVSSAAASGLPYAQGQVRRVQA